MKSSTVNPNVIGMTAAVASEQVKGVDDGGARRPTKGAAFEP